jgi:hypothetical protein
MGNGIKRGVNKPSIGVFAKWSANQNCELNTRAYTKMSRVTERFVTLIILVSEITNAKVIVPEGL